MHRLTAISLLLMLALLSTHSDACTRMYFNAYLLARTDSVDSLISQSENKENRAIQSSGSVEIAIDITGTLHTAQLKAVKIASPSSSEVNTQSTGDNDCWQRGLFATGKYVIDTVKEQIKTLTATSPAVLEVTMEPDCVEQAPPSHPLSGNLNAFFQHAPEGSIWMQQEIERSIPGQVALRSKTITLDLPTGESFQRSYVPDLNDQPHRRTMPEPTPHLAPFTLIQPAFQPGGSQPLAVGLNIKANPKGATKTETPEKKATVIGLPSLFTQSREPPRPDFYTSCWLPELLPISSNTAVNCLLSFNSDPSVAKNTLTAQFPPQTDPVTFVSIDNRTWKYIIWDNRYGTKLLLEQLARDDTAFSDAQPCTTDREDTFLDDLNDAMKDAD